MASPLLLLLLLAHRPPSPSTPPLVYIKGKEKRTRQERERERDTTTKTQTISPLPPAERALTEVEGFDNGGFPLVPTSTWIRSIGRIPSHDLSSARRQRKRGDGRRGGGHQDHGGRERLHGISRIVRRVGECLLTAFDHSATATKGEKLIRFKQSIPPSLPLHAAMGRGSLVDSALPRPKTPLPTPHQKEEEEGIEREVGKDSVSPPPYPCTGAFSGVKKFPQLPLSPFLV